MKSHLVHLVKLIFLGVVLILSAFNNTQAQAPNVRDALCAYCHQKNGHKPGCFQEPCTYCGWTRNKHSPSCTKGKSEGKLLKPNIEQQITLQIFEGIINNMFKNTNKPKQQTEAEKLRQQQQEQIEQQRLAAMLAKQKRYNDSVAQARHDKIMKEYKPFESEGELTYKGLDNKDKEAVVHFSCKITKVKGNVKVFKSNGAIINLNGDNSVDLAPGDWIATGANGLVKLHYEFENGGADVMYGRNAIATIKVDDNGVHVPELKKGQVYFTDNIIQEKVAEVMEGLDGLHTELEGGMKDLRTALKSEQKKLKGKFEVRTPNAICGVRGTEFTINVDSSGHTEITVFKGIVDVSDLNFTKTISLTDKTIGIINKNGKVIGPVELKEMKEEKWWME